MARTVTLTQLLARVRHQADLENQTNRHPDSYLTTDINQAIQDLRLLLSRNGNEYYLTEDTSGVTVAGTKAYALPDDFLAAHGVSVTAGSGKITLSDFSLVERDTYDDQFGSDGVPASYRVVGEYLWFLPTPDSAYSYSLLYTPVATDLLDGDDTFDGVAGWEDWVVFDAAARALARDDDDEQFAKMLKLKQDKERLILSEADRRRRGTPGHRRDVRGIQKGAWAHRWWLR